MPYLLSSTTLRICGSPKDVLPLPPSHISAIPHIVILDVREFSKQPLELDQFYSLRTLELRNIDVWCKYHDETYLQSATADEFMINLALFNLYRITPRLTWLCLDSRKPFEVLLCCQYMMPSTTQETIHAVIDISEKVFRHKSRGPAIRASKCMGVLPPIDYPVG
ncbi:uncharacterized protein A1O5_01659 [Cladophialophora psammophila CBS 110553]|uniref:Uncharacterized protein n=1 Tax=Cladophialophora psammophila CBS 110553 TaxID=1182543 RepID=W9X455_9EURO|nr:uncharacterized protein A1O5_01659 [Cladophialophora psammophila CBS 110553]EXJ74963.1 hypothetical protein A1O5_01659 [Cladophialophora psammophila CBS 110553]